MAIKEGCRKAKPCILEPMMKVEIEIPEEFTGTIIGDISRRRGRIEGQEPQGNTGNVIVRAIVPLANISCRGHDQFDTTKTTHPHACYIIIAVCRCVVKCFYKYFSTFLTLSHISANCLILAVSPKIF